VDIVADLTILDIGAAVDTAPRANGGLAFEVGVGTDHRVLSNRDVFSEVDCVWVF